MYVESVRETIRYEVGALMAAERLKTLSAGGRALTSDREGTLRAWPKGYACEASPR